MTHEELAALAAARPGSVLDRRLAADPDPNIRRLATTSHTTTAAAPRADRPTGVDPVTISFPQPTEPWSLNGRDHWSQRSRRARLWRAAAAEAAAHLGPRPRQLVTIELGFRHARRRDPHNWVPGCKAVVDGLVDAGVWPDDTPGWVTLAEPVLTTDWPICRITLTGP